MEDTHLRRFILVPATALRHLYSAAQLPDPHKTSFDDARTHMDRSLQDTQLPASLRKAQYSQDFINYLAEKEFLEQPLRLGIHGDAPPPPVPVTPPPVQQQLPVQQQQQQHHDDDNDDGGADYSGVRQLFRRADRDRRLYEQLQPTPRPLSQLMRLDRRGRSQQQRESARANLAADRFGDPGGASTSRQTYHTPPTYVGPSSSTAATDGSSSPSARLRFSPEEHAFADLQLQPIKREAVVGTEEAEEEEESVRRSTRPSHPPDWLQLGRGGGVGWRHRRVFPFPKWE
jgi:hypothetical protein